MTFLIPHDWQSKKLEDLMIKIIDYRGKSVPKADRGIPLITARNIRQGFLDFTNQEYIDEKKYDEWMTRGVPMEGDILFTTEAPLGCVCRYPREGKYAIGQRTITLRTNAKILNPDFLLYFFLSKHGQRTIDFQSTGSTAKGIKASKLKKLEICFPSDLNEQGRIAAIIETWDKTIEKMECKINAKMRVKDGLMQKLLTGGVRLSGFSGDWVGAPAGKIFKNVSNKNHLNEPLLSATQEFGVVPRDTLEGRVTMPTGSTSTYKLVEEGDFVISLRSFQGGIEYSNHRGIVSPAYTVLKPGIMISSDFYRIYFKSPEFISKLDAAVFGIRDGKQISYDDFCNIVIPNPTIDEQKEIAKVLVTCEKEISVLERKLLKLRTQKNYLLNNLVTGRIRTPANMLISKS